MIPGLTKKTSDDGTQTERRPMFTDEDKANITWFWQTYLKKRTPWLGVVAGLILVQGLVYQQFLALTESGLRVIFQDGRMSDLFNVCALVFGLFTVRGIVSFVVPRLSTWLASNAVLELRRDLIAHLLRLELDHFDKMTAGDVMFRLVQQADSLSTFVGQTTVNAFRDLVMVVVVSAYLIYKAPILYFSAIIIAPAILLALQMVSHHIKQVQKDAQAATGLYMNTLEEAVNGIRTVKIANQESFEEGRLMTATRNIRDRQIKLQSAQAIILPAIDLASAFAYALVIGFGGYMAIAPGYGIDGATVITFLLGLIMVFDPMRSLSKFFTTLQARLIMLNSVKSLLNTQSSIAEAPDATDTFDRAGDIVFDGVTFSYAQDDPLFRNLSMTFAGQQRTAIVGSTGSGKTTVLSLLGRLYERSEGTITIGGTDIQDMQISALRRSFAVVSQDIVIFNASIFDNIKYVRDDATKAEVWEAAENAEIADLMRRRADKPLGAKGSQLSGGQKQRIAIARAFLRSAPILLLDEATSALDQRTEEKVKLALNRLSQGKTTVIVSHRLSAITDVDKIYVLEGGRVVEQGTHDELIADGGLYAGMYTTQKDAYV